MRRLGLIFCIYISIINGICNGFEIEDYRGFVFILAFVFFFYWSIITSDFFYNHKLLRWIQYVQYFILAGYILIDARRLLSGGIALCNRLFDVLNVTYHREFSYFSGVNEATAQADILIFAAILLLLYSGILLLSRRHIWFVLLESMPAMILLMIFSPQAIHGNFFVYFAGIMGLYYIEHHKEKTAVISFGIMMFGAVFFLLYPSTELFGQEMTSIRQGSMVFAEYISHVMNGDRSVFTLNFGDIKNEATKKMESNTIFSVKMRHSENMLYFRSFVGQEYEDGKWKQNPNALSEELLEDYEKMINMKLEDVPSFHPVIRNMEVSYRDDEIDALYPYYTTSLKNEDGLVYYVSVGDYNQFLDNTDSIVSQMEKDGIYNWNYESQLYHFVLKENLGIPAGLKEVCQQLISELEIGNDSEIEIVSQIRKYLNDDFTLTANAGSAPEKEDPTEYFLSQSKRGNISEYASAMTLLLRSCQISARYVEGYMLNEDDFNNAPITEGKMTLTVDNEDAYAWVEIYRKGIGWIPVNPVSGDALIAASDAREIELPSLPRITMTPGELVQAVVKVVLLAIVCCIIRVIVIHYVISKKKKQMTRAERIQWYARIWDRYKYRHFDPKIQMIIEEAEYSNHTITEEEEQAVYEAAYLVREEYRKKLPVYMNVFDVFLACRDIL